MSATEPKESEITLELERKFAKEIFFKLLDRWKNSHGSHENLLAFIRNKFLQVGLSTQEISRQTVNNLVLQISRLINQSNNPRQMFRFLLEMEAKNLHLILMPAYQRQIYASQYTNIKKIRSPSNSYFCDKVIEKCQALAQKDPELSKFLSFKDHLEEPQDLKSLSSGHFPAATARDALPSLCFIPRLSGLGLNHLHHPGGPQPSSCHEIEEILTLTKESGRSSYAIRYFSRFRDQAHLHQYLEKKSTEELVQQTELIRQIPSLMRVIFTFFKDSHSAPFRAKAIDLTECLFFLLKLRLTRLQASLLQLHESQTQNQSRTGHGTRP